MKRFRKVIIIAIAGIILSCGLGYLLYNALVDENSLSIAEKSG